MKLKLVFILLFISTIGFAQKTTYEEDVKNFMVLNGTMSHYEGAVYQLIDLLKTQYEHVPDRIWEDLKREGILSLNELNNELVVVYQKFFTHDEIKELNDIYKAKIVQKFLSQQLQITRNSEEAISEWSRKLYIQLTDTLEEIGYSKNP